MFRPNPRIYLMNLITRDDVVYLGVYNIVEFVLSLNIKMSVFSGPFLKPNLRVERRYVLLPRRGPKVRK